MATDQSRARALARALVGPEGLSEDVVAGVELVLAAVRLDERGRICTYLRERAGHGRARSWLIADALIADALAATADAIERLEHEEGR